MIAAAQVFDGVAIVLELHEPMDVWEGPHHWRICQECGHKFPCPTARALGVTA